MLIDHRIKPVRQIGYKVLQVCRFNSSVELFFAHIFHTVCDIVTQRPRKQKRHLRNNRYKSPIALKIYIPKISAIYTYISAVGKHESYQHVQQGGFSGTGLSYKSYGLSLLHLHG